jgi:hypothetical protein
MRGRKMADFLACDAYDGSSLIDRLTRVRARERPISGSLSHASQMRGVRLRDLARAVDRLGPSRRNPEQFHEDKSEIAAELRRLAREIAS